MNTQKGFLILITFFSFCTASASQSNKDVHKLTCSTHSKRTLKTKKNKKKDKFKDIIKAENEYLINNIKVTPNSIFVFDINDVIIKPDYETIWNIIRNKVLKDKKLSFFLAAINPRLQYTIFRELYKQDNAVPEQILSVIQKKYPKYQNLIYPSIEIANAQCLIPGIYEILSELKKKNYPLLLLTNVSDDKLYNVEQSSLEMLKTNFAPIFDMFDYKTSQFTTKYNNYIKKPNPLFYMIFKEKIKKEYGTHRIKDLIFIDDKLKNIIAARKQNIHSIWFISSNDLLEKLKKRGLKTDLILK